MIIQYNQDGSVASIIGSNIFRASNKVNIVDMTIEYPQNSVVQISLKQDDDSLVPAKQCMLAQLEDGTYVWRYYLTAYDLRLNGNLSISYIITPTTEETTLTTEIVSAIVQDSNASETEPVDPSTTDTIMQNIANLDANKQNKVDTTINVVGGNQTVVTSLNVLDAEKQNISDNNLTTVAKTIVGAINELNNLKQNSTDQSLQTVAKTIIGAINELLTTKQAINDSTLQTTNKTVSGAINENRQSIMQTTQQVAQNTNAIAQNTNDISYLKQNMSTGEDLIGTLVTQENPATPEELTAFVVQERNRQPKNGDSIYNQVDKAQATDELYRCSFNGATWSSLLIPGIESAKNGVNGTIKGTYGVGATFDVLIDIVNGSVNNIYIKVGDTYQNLVNVVNSNTTSISAITGQVNGLIDGSVQSGNAATLNGQAASELSVLNAQQLGGKVESQLSVNNASLLSGKAESQLSVANSVKATQDANGNVINTYYAPINSVYSKQQSDDRFLSKSFGNLWYLSSSGLVLTPPTEPASGIQFTGTFNAAGTEQQLFQLDHSIVGDLEFNSATACEIVPKLAFSRNVNVIVKVNYFVKKQTESDFTQIGVVTSDELAISGGTNYPIVTIQNLKTSFSLIPLGTFIDLVPGDTLRIQMLLTFTSSEAVTVNLYSNEASPSTYRLALDNTVVLESNTGAVNITVQEGAWTLDQTDNVYTTTIPQSTHHISPTQNLLIQARYLNSAEVYESIDVASSTDTNGNITLYSTAPITLYVLIAGGAYENGGVSWKQKEVC